MVQEYLAADKLKIEQKGGVVSFLDSEGKLILNRTSKTKNAYKLVTAYMSESHHMYQYVGNAVKIRVEYKDDVAQTEPKAASQPNLAPEGGDSHYLSLEKYIVEVKVQGKLEGKLRLISVAIKDAKR